MDAACLTHDIAYAENKSLDARHKADIDLENRVCEQVKSENASLGGKTADWVVTNTMKVKRKLGSSTKFKNTRKINLVKWIA